MNTNLKIVVFVLGAVGFFVAFASSIPQVESRPPAETILSGNMSPDQLAEAGKAIVTGDKGGCLNCHGIGQAGPRAPNLAGVGARAATRIAESDYTGHATGAEGYLRESLLDPCVFKVPGYDCLMGGLALDKNLTPAEITAVIAFLESLGGQITVNLSAEDLAATPAAAPAGGAGIAGTTAKEITAGAGCGGCHTLAALGLTGKVGPDLSMVGARRTPDEIRQSILDPGAVIAESCPSGPCPDNVMPRNFGERLTAAQVETLVTFLSSQGGQTAGTQPKAAATEAGAQAQPTAAATQAAAAPAESAAAPTQLPATAVAAQPASPAGVSAQVGQVQAKPLPPPSPLLYIAAVVGLPGLTILFGAGLAFGVLTFSRLRAEGGK